MPGKAYLPRAATQGILGTGGNKSRDPDAYLERDAQTNILGSGGGGTKAQTGGVCYSRPADKGILTSKKTPKKSTGSW